MLQYVGPITWDCISTKILKHYHYICFPIKWNLNCLLDIGSLRVTFVRCFEWFTLNWARFFLFFVLNSCFVPHLYCLNLAVIKHKLGLIDWLLWSSFAQPVLFVVIWNVLFVAYLQRKHNLTWLYLTFIVISGTHATYDITYLNEPNAYL